MIKLSRNKDKKDTKHQHLIHTETSLEHLNYIRKHISKPNKNNTVRQCLGIVCLLVRLYINTGSVKIVDGNGREYNPFEEG